MNRLRFLFRSLIWSTGALLGASVLSAGAGAVSPAEQVLAREGPLIIAHRGFSAWAPENTLPAFALALRTEADLIELDYHVTADGEPVVFHDYTLDRTTDVVAQRGGERWALAEQAAADLTELDAGSWFSPAFAGAKVPTLGEALDLIQGGGGVTLIERKAGPAAGCAAVLREKQLINEVIVQAFDWAFLEELHAAVPEQVLGALGPLKTWEGRKLTSAERVLTPEWVARAAATGARVIGWNRQVTAEGVAAAHARGVKVVVYTINELPLAESLLALGVDGIITDNPVLIARVRE